MKNIFIRMTVILTLLLALVLFFGIHTSGTAHAAVAAPNINSVACPPGLGPSEFFEVNLTNDGRFCFANAGETYPAFLTNVTGFCSGNNAGFVIIAHNGQYDKAFFAKKYCSFPFEPSGLAVLHID